MDEGVERKAGEIMLRLRQAVPDAATAYDRRDHYYNIENGRCLGGLVPIAQVVYKIFLYLLDFRRTELIKPIRNI